MATTLVRFLSPKSKHGRNFNIHETWIKIDKKKPNNPIEIGDEELLKKGNHFLIIDDVGNTGRTLFYIMRLFGSQIIKSIQCAVLVDRTHKSFPVNVDFVGLSLATTYKEEVIVEFDKKGNVEGAYLY